MIVTVANTDHVDHCDHNYIVANLVCFGIYVVDIVFVIYSVKKIGEGYFKSYERHGNNQSIASEVVKFLCYDIFVLLFILFALFAFAWNIVMLVWTNDENPYCEEEEEGILTATEFMAGWHITMMFIGLGFFVLVLCFLS